MRVDNTTITPVGKDIYLIVKSTTTWLKETFEVQIVCDNTSAVETVEDLTANLTIPEGLSLAIMTEGMENEAEAVLGDVLPKGTTSHKWYICGDKEGEYSLDGTLTGTRTGGGISEDINLTFGVEDSIAVLAGSAMQLTIDAETRGIVGEPYYMRYTLENVSGKSLYDLSFSVFGGKFFEDFGVVEVKYAKEYGPDAIEDLDGKGFVFETEEFKPGDKVQGALTKEGYTFEGWYTDKELTTAYDFASKVTKNFTLYAKWTEIEKEPVVDEPETTISFSDVKENDWFYANIQYVVENKLMNGVAENKFAPNDTLTRAMLVTVLYRNAGEPATNRSIPFADVDMGSYYANAVSWAKQNGIVSGVTENEFAPDANITREQIAAIMFRYAQYKGMDALTLEENLHFTDANEISEYAVSAMNWAVGTGLMNGKSATTLNPKDNATRAEIAAILQRFIEANK